jgi:2-acylglycerol O-acyltransferase 2
MALGDWAMMGAAKYFRLKVISDDHEELTKYDQAIFAMEPHDVLPLGIFSFQRSLNPLPNFKMFGCITGACFQVPIMKHVYTWCSAVSVDKKSIKSMLRRGISPCICPGGVQEVTLMDRSKKECILYLKKRFGFIKLALEYGKPLVPCFVFGHDKSFSWWVPKVKFLQTLGRKIGFALMMFFGAFGLPMGPAYPCDYVAVVGAPIPVDKVENPTEEDLKRVQAVFLESMTDLFERYKHEYGYGDIHLNIQ